MLSKVENRKSPGGTRGFGFSPLPRARCSFHLCHSLEKFLVCGQKLLDLIDCKVSAMGRARQLISVCLTAYIRRITSERMGTPTGICHVRNLGAICDLREAQLQ